MKLKLYLLMAFVTFGLFQVNAMQYKTDPYEVLGVHQNATQNEIESHIKDLKLQKAIRRAGFWPAIAKAYEDVLGKKFELFEIRHSLYISFPSEYEQFVKHAAYHILHVNNNATKEQIENAFQQIQHQKIIRTPAEQVMIIIAYEYLTGNKAEFNDFTENEIDEGVDSFKKVVKQFEAFCKIFGVAIALLRMSSMMK
jgi:hypothetical protein